MNNIKFYLVFLYSFKTRIKTKLQRVSFIFIYFLPVCFFGFLFELHKYNQTPVDILIVGILGVYSVYELGYIFNDVYAIRKEVNPTLRLNVPERKYVENHIVTICFFRLLVSALCIIYIQSIVFLVGILIILVLYFFYNSVQGYIRLLFHFLLSSLRYYLPVASFEFSLWAFFLMVLSFPLINTIERMSEPKFALLKDDFLLSNKKTGRYVYYLIIIPILYPILKFYGLSEVFLLPFLYFAVYRYLSLNVYEKLV